MRIRGNSVARSLIQRMASRFSRKGSMSSTSGRRCRTSLFASSKVCAAPQTWYRGSRPMIATKPCSLMMVSPTATTRHGSLPPRAGALFFTSDASFNKSFGSLQSFICVVYENIDRPSPDETGCLLFLRKDQGEVSEKRAMVGRQRGYTAQAIEVNRPYLAPGPRLAISATTITLPCDRGEYEKNAA